MVPFAYYFCLWARGCSKVRATINILRYRTNQIFCRVFLIKLTIFLCLGIREHSEYSARELYREFRMKGQTSKAKLINSAWLKASPCNGKYFAATILAHVNDVQFV